MELPEVKSLTGALVGLQETLELELVMAAHADHAIAGTLIMLLARQLSDRGLLDYGRLIQDATEISRLEMEGEQANNEFFPPIRENYLNRLRAGAIRVIPGGRE